MAVSLQSPLFRQASPTSRARLLIRKLWLTSASRSGLNWIHCRHLGRSITSRPSTTTAEPIQPLSRFRTTGKSPPTTKPELLHLRQTYPLMCGTSLHSMGHPADTIFALGQAQKTVQPQPRRSLLSGSHLVATAAEAIGHRTEATTTFGSSWIKTPPPLSIRITTQALASGRQDRITRSSSMTLMHLPMSLRLMLRSAPCTQTMLTPPPRLNNPT